MEDNSSMDSPASSPASSCTDQPSTSSSMGLEHGKGAKATDCEETKGSMKRIASKKRFPGGYQTRSRAARASSSRSGGNLLQKLRDRETQIGLERDKMFRRLPIRLIFCLKDTVPISALEAGHIFLGFSKCGQFLLSYTQTTADIELMGDIHINYHYRLHWWSFIPYKRAKKVAEVMLFSNQGAPGNLHLAVCQWPNDVKKILVFAYSLGHGDCGEDPENMANSKSCFLTITAVPSLRGCKECVRVAGTYEEDDFAAAWNSCARLSCLEHGMTLHTSFDLVQPYPKFEPRISLKRDNYILINTGNLFHSLHVTLERLENSTEEPPLITPTKTTHHQTSPPQKAKWSELNIGTSEFTISVGGVFSPPMCSPPNRGTGTASDSENTDYESDSGTNAKYVIHNQDRLAKVAEFADRCQLPRPSRQFIRARGALFQLEEQQPSYVSSSKKRQAEKAYEITDDDFDEGVREQFNTFRKKRLAEKKYEFKDEDSENVTPLRRLRSQTRANQEESGAGATSGATGNGSSNSLESEDCVLRPLHSNQNLSQESSTSSICVSTEHEDVPPGLLMVDTMPVPELLSPGSMVKKDQSQQHSVMLSPRNSDQDPPRFHAKFTRRFIEQDDEMISVITDIEDEELGPNTASTINFHLVLPLEVHGAGYQSMAMISNAKAGKISGRCIKVQQRSLDLEMFCHFMAQKLCSAANRKYWYCNDYDVEIIDLDSESGDVICVAVVLVKATIVTKKVSQHQKYSISSFHRHQYQATFKFTWNIFTAECTVIDSEPLTEIDGYNIYPRELEKPSGGSSSVWHPAKNISSALQKTWGVLTSSHVKCFTNDAVIRGTSLETIVDTEHLVAIIQDNLS